MLGMKIVYLKAKDWTLWDTEQSRNRQFFPTETQLVGWLIQEDKEKIVIAMEWIPNPFGDDLRHVISIPRSCVEIMRELLEVSR